MKIEFQQYRMESDREFVYRISRAAKELKMDIFKHNARRPDDIKRGVTLVTEQDPGSLITKYIYHIDE